MALSQKTFFTNKLTSASLLCAFIPKATSFSLLAIERHKIIFGCSAFKTTHRANSDVIEKVCQLSEYIRWKFSALASSIESTQSFLLLEICFEFWYLIAKFREDIHYKAMIKYSWSISLIFSINSYIVSITLFSHYNHIVCVFAVNQCFGKHAEWFVMEYI